MDVKLSVIVPIYNGEKYLERCIESILKQSVKNLELILVNDGSTDKTKNICNEYLKKDSRIKVIHKENGGVSSARNKALEVVRGKYIGFVDCDDWIDQIMYDQLIQDIEKFNADIAVAGFVKEYENGNKIKKKHYEKQTFNSEDALKSMIKQELFSWEMCDKLYRKELFEKIRFIDELIYGEDLVVNYCLFKAANLCVINNQGWYHYFQHPESACNANFSLKSLNFLDSIKLVHEKVKSECVTLEPLVRYLYIKVLIGFSLELIYSGVVNKEKIKFIELRKEIREQLNFYLTSEFITKKEIILGSVFYCPISVEIVIGKYILSPLCRIKRKFS